MFITAKKGVFGNTISMSVYKANLTTVKGYKLFIEKVIYHFNITKQPLRSSIWSWLSATPHPLSIILLT
jgi:hypothetical protein